MSFLKSFFGDRITFTVQSLPVFCGVLHFASLASAQGPPMSSMVERGYLKASNVGVFDGFAWAVAVSGEMLVVGTAYEDSGDASDSSDDSVPDSGAIYVFRRQPNGTWLEEAFLKASNLGEGDEFGRSVSVSGDILVVGAPREDSGIPFDGNDNSARDSGAAYVFRRHGNGTWLEEACLKYAFNMTLNGWDVTPMVSGGDRGLPLVCLTEKEGKRFLKFEFVRRRNGPRYLPEKSNTLDPGSFVPVEGAWIVEPINEVWERVRVTEPLYPLELQSFGRVRILLE